ncbi:GSCOCG00003608001-RA-CDS, partial [Cotesia congregata]
IPSQVEASLIKMRSLLIPASSYSVISFLAFSMLASLSKDNLASTSVDTRPGMMFRISWPNKTQVMSIAASVCSSKKIFQFSTTYFFWLAAARINDGLVVASVGLNCSIA